MGLTLPFQLHIQADEIGRLRASNRVSGLFMNGICDVFGAHQNE